jgi:hypothetical protein
MSSPASQLKVTASRAADSKPLEYLARGGFVCYGVIHLLFAWLALQVAFGHPAKEGDQSGALQSLAGLSYGKVLLGVIAVGMVGLAIWQAFEAAIGESGPRTKAAIAERVINGVRAVIYLWLAWTAVKVLRGVNADIAGNQQKNSSQLMSQTDGRWLVGLIGVVVVGVGAGLFAYGYTKKFLKHLNTQQMSPSVRKSTRRLGISGYLAKGIAYAIVGILVVTAAVTYQPDQARGLDAALKTLTSHAYGNWLLAVIAVGFAAFGIYCFFQAKYRKV